MKILISPAKTLDFDNPAPIGRSSTPFALEKSKILIEELRKIDSNALSKLMSLSDKLAMLNVERYHAWDASVQDDKGKQAVYAFKGDVYVGLDAETLTEAEALYAQETLLILSGLYGLLRPLDYIKPYRLEMGTKLSVGGARNLYEYWKKEITDSLNKQIGGQRDGLVVNLASNEYFKAVDAKMLSADIVSPVFKDFKNGQYKVISFFAKKARGYMARYLIQNRIVGKEDLLGFDVDGYRYSEELSMPNKPTFIRG